MTDHHLYAHAAHPGTAIHTLVAEVTRPTPQRLQFRFIAAGAAGEVLLPAPAAPARKDELWRTTCFEAFLRPVGSRAYRELNFSPSAEWAAYAFDDYRAGMRDAPVIDAPVIELTVEAKRLLLDVTLSLDLPPEPHELALSAIIEEKEGTKMFWALAHPPGAPDFHNAACFAADLPPPERA